MAAVPTEGEETSEPLKYKTWVLKVSIHCEGCKRKVKRILHGVEGVYTIDVDAKQHKVTVTGNVDSNTLIRKLEKSGKHAELWPDSQKNGNKSKKNEQEQANEDQQGNQSQNPAVEKEKVTVSVEEPPPKGDEQQVKEVRFEGNISAAGDNQNPPINNAGAGGNGGKKKKKKKKGHNGNNNNNVNNCNSEGAGEQQGVNGGPPSTESPPQPGPASGPSPNPNPGPVPGPVNMSPPRHPAYYAPPPPPQPVYAVSYNTAYPSTSYRASYYSAPPPHAYAYVHHRGDEGEYQPSDWNGYSASQPSDTFEMFSDENPNACSVM